mgnify:FL=1
MASLSPYWIVGIGFLLIALGVIFATTLASPASGPRRARGGVLKIGIVGNGILGSTHAKFARIASLDVETYDVLPERSSVASLEALADRDLILVCVNTPPGQDGQTCDTSQVESVCGQLDAAAKMTGRRLAVLIKSTIILGAFERIEAACSNLALGYSPERLREARPEEDFKAEGFVILSGDESVMLLARDFSQPILPKVAVHYTNAITAAAVKYALNTAQALLVSFANSLFDLTQAGKIDWDEFVCLFRLDPRFTNLPLQVPGPPDRNGRRYRGWGNSCLPKDSAALSKWAEQHGVQSLVHLIAVAWHVNRAQREESSWDCIAAAHAKGGGSHDTIQ